ncbi:MAG: hypothetical protein ACRD3G_21305 [Vicinamibacterales bacterium]
MSEDLMMATKTKRTKKSQDDLSRMAAETLGRLDCARRLKDARADIRHLKAQVRDLRWQLAQAKAVWKFFSDRVPHLHQELADFLKSQGGNHA